MNKIQWKKDLVLSNLPNNPIDETALSFPNPFGAYGGLWVMNNSYAQGLYDAYLSDHPDGLPPIQITNPELGYIYGGNQPTPCTGPISNPCGEGQWEYLDTNFSQLEIGPIGTGTIKVPEGTTAIYIDFGSFLDFGTDSDGNVIGHKIGWQHCGHTYIGGGPDGEERVLSTYWGDVEQTDDGFVMTDTMCTEQYDINQNSGQFPGAPECAAWDGGTDSSPQPCEACDSIPGCFWNPSITAGDFGCNGYYDMFQSWNYSNTACPNLFLRYYDYQYHSPDGAPDFTSRVMNIMHGARRPLDNGPHGIPAVENPDYNRGLLNLNNYFNQESGNVSLYSGHLDNDGYGQYNPEAVNQDFNTNTTIKIDIQDLWNTPSGDTVNRGDQWCGWGGIRLYFANADAIAGNANFSSDFLQLGISVQCKNDTPYNGSLELMSHNRADWNQYNSDFKPGSIDNINKVIKDIAIKSSLDLNTPAAEFALMSYPFVGDCRQPSSELSEYCLYGSGNTWTNPNFERPWEGNTFINGAIVDDAIGNPWGAGHNYWPYLDEDFPYNTISQPPYLENTDISPQITVNNPELFEIESDVGTFTMDTPPAGNTNPLIPIIRIIPKPGMSGTGTFTITANDRGVQKNVYGIIQDTDGLGNPLDTSVYSWSEETRTVTPPDEIQTSTTWTVVISRPHQWDWTSVPLPVEYPLSNDYIRYSLPHYAHKNVTDVASDPLEGYFLPQISSPAYEGQTERGFITSGEYFDSRFELTNSETFVGCKSPFPIRSIKARYAGEGSVQFPDTQSGIVEIDEDGYTIIGPGTPVTSPDESEVKTAAELIDELYDFYQVVYGEAVEISLQYDSEIENLDLMYPASEGPPYVYVNPIQPSNTTSCNPYRSPFWNYTGVKPDGTGQSTSEYFSGLYELEWDNPCPAFDNNILDCINHVSGVCNYNYSLNMCEFDQDNMAYPKDYSLFRWDMGQDGSIQYPAFGHGCLTQFACEYYFRTKYRNAAEICDVLSFGTYQNQETTPYINSRFIPAGENTIYHDGTTVEGELVYFNKFDFVYTPNPFYGGLDDGLTFKCDAGTDDTETNYSEYNPFGYSSAVGIRVSYGENATGFGYDESLNIPIEQSLLNSFDPYSGIEFDVEQFDLQNTEEFMNSLDYDGRPSLGMFYYEDINPLEDSFISFLPDPFQQVSKNNLITNADGKYLLVDDEDYEDFTGGIDDVGGIFWYQNTGSYQGQLKPNTYVFDENNNLVSSDNSNYYGTGEANSYNNKYLKDIITQKNSEKRTYIPQGGWTYLNLKGANRDMSEFAKENFQQWPTDGWDDLPAVQPGEFELSRIYSSEKVWFTGWDNYLTPLGKIKYEDGSSIPATNEDIGSLEPCKYSWRWNIVNNSNESYANWVHNPSKNFQDDDCSNDNEICVGPRTYPSFDGTEDDEETFGDSGLSRCVDRDKYLNVWDIVNSSNCTSASSGVNDERCNTELQNTSAGFCRYSDGSVNNTRTYMCYGYIPPISAEQLTEQPGECEGEIPCSEFTQFYGGDGDVHCDRTTDCRWEGNECVNNAGTGHACSEYESCMTEMNTVGYGYCTFIPDEGYEDWQPGQFIGSNYENAIKEKLPWARWIIDSECLSWGRCLEFEYYNPTDSADAEYWFNQVSHNKPYTTLNQVQELLNPTVNEESVSLQGFSSLRVSFWMKTVSSDGDELPIVESSIIVGQLGNPTGRNGSTWAANQNYDISDNGGIIPGSHNSATSRININPGDDIFGGASRFKNSVIGVWEKMEFTFNLTEEHMDDDGVLYPLYFAIQYGGASTDYYDGPFQGEKVYGGIPPYGRILLDNFSVVEGYDFVPDADVRKKISESNYGMGSLTEYYDPYIPTQIDLYESTKAPIEASFYFYPRYNSNAVFDVERPIIHNDFRNGLFYLYDIDWGDGTTNEFVAEPKQLGNNKMIYHTYENSGIYEITGTMLRIRPDNDLNKLGVINNQRFVLRININEGLDEDFTYFGSDGFSFIPFKNTLPVIGGTNKQSIYYKTIKRQLGFISDTIKANVKYKKDSDKLKTESALAKMDYELTPLRILPEFEIERYDEPQERLITPLSIYFNRITEGNGKREYQGWVGDTMAGFPHYQENDIFNANYIAKILDDGSYGLNVRYEVTNLNLNTWLQFAYNATNLAHSLPYYGEDENQLSYPCVCPPNINLSPYHPCVISQGNDYCIEYYQSEGTCPTECNLISNEGKEFIYKFDIRFNEIQIPDTLKSTFHYVFRPANCVNDYNNQTENSILTGFPADNEFFYYEDIEENINNGSPWISIEKVRKLVANYSTVHYDLDNVSDGDVRTIAFPRMEFITSELGDSTSDIYVSEPDVPRVIDFDIRNVYLVEKSIWDEHQDSIDIQPSGNIVYSGKLYGNLKEELGKSIGDSDLSNIRYFNQPIEMWEMLGFTEINPQFSQEAEPPEILPSDVCDQCLSVCYFTNEWGTWYWEEYSQTWQIDIFKQAPSEEGISDGDIVSNSDGEWEWFLSGSYWQFINPLCGCTDPSACNYDENAGADDGTCEYPADFCDCDGNIVEPFCDCDGTLPTGVCDCFGNIPDGYCDCNGNTPITLYGSAIVDCEGNCNNDVDGDFVCDEEDDCIGVLDDCGICNGSNYFDDDGLINGTYCDCDENILDNCGICNGGIFVEGDCAEYESCCDCAGVPNGSNEFANQSYCNSAGYECIKNIEDLNQNQFSSMSDGICGDLSVIADFCYNPEDVGECDCDGNVLDECGVCGGEGNSTSGVEGEVCDCDGGVFDECGICNGWGLLGGVFCDCPDENNVQPFEDCAGDCGGDSEYDSCGNCGNPPPGPQYWCQSLNQNVCNADLCPEDEEPPVNSEALYGGECCNYNLWCEYYASTTNQNLSNSAVCKSYLINQFPEVFGGSVTYTWICAPITNSVINIIDNSIGTCVYANISSDVDGSNCDTTIPPIERTATPNSMWGFIWDTLDEPDGYGNFNPHMQGDALYQDLFCYNSPTWAGGGLLIPHVNAGGAYAYSTQICSDTPAGQSSACEQFLAMSGGGSVMSYSDMTITRGMGGGNTFINNRIDEMYHPNNPAAPTYWKNIIPEDYSIFKREGIFNNSLMIYVGNDLIPHYFEEFDVNNDGFIDVTDEAEWINIGRSDIAEIISEINSTGILPPSIYDVDELPLNYVPNLDLYQQNWIGENEYGNTYYYPVLPKYDASGNFSMNSDGIYNYPYYNDNGSFIEKVPFPQNAPITDDNFYHPSLRLSIKDNELVDNNVYYDNSGNNNKAFAISDYKPKFDRKTFELKKTKRTNRLLNTKNKRAF